MLMRRFLFSIVLLFQVCIAHAQARWDGEAGDSQWDNATNWVGNAVPLTTDNVLLDNSVVLGNYTVNLPTGVVSISVNSLTITPLVGNTITLLNPVTNTSPTAFTAIGAGDAVILNNGAIFKNSSGAASGTTVSVTSTNFFRINNGGRYIHNTTRAHTDYLVSRLSSVAGTENGTFEFDVPAASFTISFDNRTYGNLEFSSSAHGAPVTYLASGNDIATVNGNLIINSAVTFSLDFSVDVVIKGNLNQAATSNFNISNLASSNSVKISGDINVAGTILETGSAFPLIVLNGTTNQNVSITNMTDNVTLHINNAAGATLTAPLTLPYNLQFTTGKIKTDAINILKMMPNSSSIGASPVSFVEGPMKKVGMNNFEFPIGVGSIFAPIGIIGSGGALITDEFTAEYKRANPQGIHGSLVQSGFNHVSYVEYWKLNQTVGTTAVKQVSLKVTTTSFCYDLDNTFVSHWNGTQWTSEGGTITGFANPIPYQTGTLTSTTTLSSFGDFTLITDLPFNSNPLPIKLITFNAVKSNPNTALLKWELAACCSDAAKFEVEKSIDNRAFVAFDKVPGSLTNRFYTLPDNRLSKGITYYRLKMIDEDGTITYSKTVALINNETGLLITSLWPNPVQNTATLTVSVAKAGKVNLTICDLSGKIVKQWNASTTEGTNNILVNMDGLASGVYHIIASGNNSKFVFRFIKQ